MYSLIIALCCGAGTGLALYLTGTCGYGWSCFFGVLGFGVVQMGIGFYMQKKVKAANLVMTPNTKLVKLNGQQWSIVVTILL